MDAFEKKWYTFSEINRKSTASTTAWATRTFLRNIQVWVIIWIITTANLWCHWFGLLSRYWFGVRLLPNSVFDSCTIYVEDGGVTAIKACLSEVQYPATEKGSATSQSRLSITAPAMKSSAKLLGFGMFSGELIYISSVLILIPFLSLVEYSNFNDNFEILWGTVRLLDNNQTTQLTMDRSSGTIFYIWISYSL